MKCNRKPTECQAMQFTGENAEEVGAFVGDYGYVLPHNILTVYVLEAEVSHDVRVGSWIIRDASDNPKVLDDETFREEYDLPT